MSVDLWVATQVSGWKNFKRRDLCSGIPHGRVEYQLPCWTRAEPCEGLAGVGRDGHGRARARANREQTRPLRPPRQTRASVTA